MTGVFGARRWLMFVAEDNRQVSDDVEAEKSEAAMEEEEDADGMTLADQDEGTGMRLWDRIYSSFSTAHSLKPRFYDPSVIDIYEVPHPAPRVSVVFSHICAPRCLEATTCKPVKAIQSVCLQLIRGGAQVAYEQVVGDLRKPLPRKKAVEFLSQVRAFSASRSPDLMHVADCAPGAARFSSTSRMRSPLATCASSSWSFRQRRAPAPCRSRGSRSGTCCASIGWASPAAR